MGHILHVAGFSFQSCFDAVQIAPVLDMQVSIPSLAVLGSLPIRYPFLQECQWFRDFQASPDVFVLLSKEGWLALLIVKVSCLFKVDIAWLDRSLFLQLPGCCTIYGLIFINKPPWQSPTTLLQRIQYLCMCCLRKRFSFVHQRLNCFWNPDDKVVN